MASRLDVIFVFIKEDWIVKLKRIFLLTILSASFTLAANAAVKVDVIKNPYSGARNSPELSTNPGGSVNGVVS